LKIYVSQGSVSTQLSGGGIFSNQFITNILAECASEIFFKLVSIWRQYEQKIAAYVCRSTPLNLLSRVVRSKSLNFFRSENVN